MKHLITNITGGFPFDLDDYRFMEGGFNEDITAILKAYRYEPQQTMYGTPPPNSFIIYGCKITTELFPPETPPAPDFPYGSMGWTWTEGAVFIDGIIYKVRANTTPMHLPIFSYTHGIYFDPAIETVSDGEESFKDGITHDTYGLRVATPSLQPRPQNKLLFSDLPRFLSGIWSGESQFTKVGSSGAPPYQGNWVGLAPDGLWYRKNAVYEVELRGHCQKLAGVGSTDVIFQLPPEYRAPSGPNVGPAYYPLMELLSGDMYNACVDHATGNVSIIGAHLVSANLHFQLSPIRFTTYTSFTF